jgi:hypothetical protein
MECGGKRCAMPLCHSSNACLLHRSFGGIPANAASTLRPAFIFASENLGCATGNKCVQAGRTLGAMMERKQREVTGWRVISEERPLSKFAIGNFKFAISNFRLPIPTSSSSKSRRLSLTGMRMPDSPQNENRCERRLANWHEFT